MKILYGRICFFLVGTIALLLILLFQTNQHHYWHPAAVLTGINSAVVYLVYLVVTVTLLSAKEIDVVLNVSPITLQKLAGIIFVIAGAWLVNKK